jgi:PAS domain S-box-containing protein
MLGVPLSKLTASSMQDYLSPVDSQILKKLLGKLTATEQIELNLITAGGTQLPALLSLARLPEDQSFCLTAADLTRHKRVETDLEQRVKERTKELRREIEERKRTEAELRESQILISAVLGGTSDLIYVKDAAGRILLANPALANVSGKSLKEILGKTDSEICADQTSGQALYENDLRVMNSGELQIIEEKVPTPSGYRTFLSSKAPLRNSSGEIVGIIGISRDITQRKRKKRIFSIVQESRMWLRMLFTLQMPILMF